MTLQRELEELMSKYCAENASNTPDFILAEYLIGCLNAYNQAVVKRAEWYGRIDVPGQGSVSPFPMVSQS
jgi:hypothetical protein